MKKIIKYYDKINKKNMIEDVKGDLSGSYKKIIVVLMNK